MSQPSSDIPIDTPLGKTVEAVREWVRENGGTWAVNEVDRAALATILALCDALEEAHAGLARKNEDGAAAYEWGSDLHEQLREAREDNERLRADICWLWSEGIDEYWTENFLGIKSDAAVSDADVLDRVRRVRSGGGEGEA